MSTKAVTVNLWGKRVCAVALRRDGAPLVQYDPDFLDGSVEISPILHPLANLRKTPYATHTYASLAGRTFNGLPGFIADALPDDFGNALVRRYMESKGILPRDITAIDRLAYSGKRAMGALEFAPAKGFARKDRPALDMATLVEEARRALHGNFDHDPEDALHQLLAVGTSAGGARAKAVIAINPATREIQGGQFDAPAGFEHWLLKFDGVGKDKELGTSDSYGKIEYAYHLMAVAAGLKMTSCQLLRENGRAHFMTKRFDRIGNEKVLVQSLCAMQHLDYRNKGINEYESYFRTINALQLGAEALGQGYARMAFNIMARNCDDHTKNFAFTLRKGGKWQLAPAYDLIYAYNPNGEWTYQHLCSVNGKFDGHTRQDLLEVAKKFNIKSPKAILDRVSEAVSQWDKFADEAGVPSDMKYFIARHIRPSLEDGRNATVNISPPKIG